MDAGRLDRRIALRRATVTANAFNDPVETWATLATVWANVAPVSDGERLRAGETLASKLNRFTIRYSATAATIDPRDRILYEGRDWDIHAVKELDRREMLEITAAARAETP